jgi:hypothetical protein
MHDLWYFPAFSTGVQPKVLHSSFSMTLIWYNCSELPRYPRRNLQLYSFTTDGQYRPRNEGLHRLSSNRGYFLFGTRAGSPLCIEACSMLQSTAYTWEENTVGGRTKGCSIQYVAKLVQQEHS